MAFTPEELAELAAFDAAIDDEDFDEEDRQESYARELKELIAERESMGDRRSNPFPLSDEAKAERAKRLNYLRGRIHLLSDPEYREHINECRRNRIKLHPERYKYDPAKKRAYYLKYRERYLENDRIYRAKRMEQQNEMRRNPPEGKANTVCQCCGHPLHRSKKEIGRSPRGNFFCDRKCYAAWRWGDKHERG